MNLFRFEHFTLRMKLDHHVVHIWIGVIIIL